ncbi:MAG: hypothetical protein V4579_13075 [Pseudomonadota bacterium]
MTAKPFQRISAVLFWIVLAAASILAIMPQPPQLPSDALGDKFNHMLAFAVLAGLAAAAWPRAPRWKVIAWLSAIGALIELVQAIPMLHRDCDVRDWVADTLAVIVVTALAALIARPGRVVRRQ